MSINQFFTKDSCQFEELGAYLDGLNAEDRKKEALSLNASKQKILWKASEGSERLTMDYFVPADTPALKPVIHWGVNSLPVFSIFEKVMCRTSDPKAHAGINASSMASIVGNGYFILRETDQNDADDHGIVVDYTQVPTEKAEEWPSIAPCKERLGRFVYHGNYDYMRRVSEHVTIGRAKKANAAKDKWMPNWFILCREG